MFMHSCCCDGADPLICDPFENDCASSLLFRNLSCFASVDFEVICPSWCDGGGDLGPTQTKRGTSARIEFDPVVLTRFDNGPAGNRYFQGSGTGTVQVDRSYTVAAERWVDCVGGSQIITCEPTASTTSQQVTTQILISCAQELGTLAQFAASPCTVAPAADDVGYLLLYASSCYGVQPSERYYGSVILEGAGGERYCDQDDFYASTPRSGWLFYAYYKAQDCILNLPPLIWRPLYGGFFNFTTISSSASQPPTCFPNLSVPTADDSNMAVKVTPTACEFDWDEHYTWSSVFQPPPGCSPRPGATFAQVPTCAQVLSGYCQQTSVQMGSFSLS